MDTSAGGRKRGDSLQVDDPTADGTDDLLVLFELSPRDRQCVSVRPCLSQQCAGLGPFVRDGCAFRIMLVVRRGERCSLNDGGDDGLEGCHLTSSPFLLGLDDRQDAVNVERTDPMSVAPPPARRNRTDSQPDNVGWARRRPTAEIAGRCRRGRSIAQALGVMRYFSPVACLA